MLISHIPYSVAIIIVFCTVIYVIVIISWVRGMYGTKQR